MIKLLTYINSSPLKEFTMGPSTIQCAKDFSCVISEQPCEVGRKLKKRGRRVVIKRGPGCRTAVVRVGLLADCGPLANCSATLTFCFLICEMGIPVSFS